MLVACASQPVATAPGTHPGAGTGTAAGAGSGALIDKDNRWRGAQHGAARAARESVASNQPVAYQSTDGWQRIETAPQGAGGARCRQVRERVYQDNQLVREQIREVC
jgi:hypothetical protein